MNIEKYVIELSNWMNYKRYGWRTIEQYKSCLKKFFGAHPDAHKPEEISATQIKEFLSRFTEPNTHKSYMGAIKMFYTKVINQPQKFKGIEYPRKKEQHIELPTVEEISALIKACDNIKHRCIIKIFVACGLRISELLSIRPEHIDEDLGVLKVFGKGSKWRNVKIPHELIKEINIYKSQNKPTEYLFEGQKGRIYTETSIRQFLIKYAQKAGIKTHIHPHLLRHFYGTYCLELGVQQRILQSQMGHNSPKTLQVYTHIRRESIAQQTTPLVFFQ